MADTHHKSGTGTPTTTRAYTVSYIRDSRTFEPAPAVTLKGHWLEQAGFETGTPLEVKVLPDCLILTVKKPSPEPEVIQALRQLCPKLSARKQRELMELIQVMARPKKRTTG
ncbi:SymE family type I addiction module toxin [Serratia symbiotica]|uniref:Type I addiction module toxin, SymE family n=1 Tax=Serratia symbiotica TaxID=138074 RepID=A0A068Z6Z0_9GAMM|nr:SymE family type I addiction module toxin [Serratia symbiotica]QLH62815.1 type I addiction module toxin, SymE family [Serratia symbiotica]CDS58004.1 Endoribonuclease SymE [Serratia symbiotica]